MKFVAHNQPAEPVQPGEEPLHDPAAQVAAQCSAVLRLAPVFAVGRNHFDPVFLFQAPVEQVRIIRLVADQLRAQIVEETAGERFVDEFGFVRRGRVDRDSQRNAVSGGDGHDLCPFAPLGLAHGEAPFFAAAKLPSIKPSSGSSFPSRRSFSASTRNAFSNWPPRTHCWKRPCTVWYGGYFLGNSRHCAPVRRIHSTPFNTARASAGGRPRPSARCGNRSNGSNSAQSASDTSPLAYIRCSRNHQSYLLCAAASRKTQPKNRVSYLSDRFYKHSPAIAARCNTTYEAAEWGITTVVAENIGNKRELEKSIAVMSSMRKAGIKVLPCGEYRFAWLPHGTGARDLEHFVNLFGYQPWKVQRAAAAWGGGIGRQIGRTIGPNCVRISCGYSAH
jgi:hypothetical protein